jgi:hypothetical protein
LEKLNDEAELEITKRSGLSMLLEVGGMDKCLEHFAKLVAQAEREACARIVDPLPYEDISARMLENRAALIRAREQQ